MLRRDAAYAAGLEDGARAMSKQMFGMELRQVMARARVSREEVHLRKSSAVDIVAWVRSDLAAQAAAHLLREHPPRVIDLPSEQHLIVEFSAYVGVPAP